MPRVNSRRWVFTLNNPTTEEIAHVSTSLSDQARIVYGVYGKEVGESGTPHLQGFFIAKYGVLLSTAKNIVGNRAHLQKARGTSEQAADYCKKEGDFCEYGTFPASQGERNDLNALFEWGDEFTTTNSRAPTSPEVADKFPVLYSKFSRITTTLRLRAPALRLQEGELRPWQVELRDKLNAEPDDRTVLFVVDREGGKGKTWFIKWWLTNHANRTQVFNGGKRDDIAYAVQEHRDVFLFNVVRGGMAYLPYSICESLKDRLVWSPKYQGRMKILTKTPHVVVFSNELPDYEKLTEDRYVVIEI